MYVCVCVCACLQMCAHSLCIRKRVQANVQATVQAKNYTLVVTMRTVRCSQRSSDDTIPSSVRFTGIGPFNDGPRTAQTDHTLGPHTKPTHTRKHAPCKLIHTLSRVCVSVWMHQIFIVSYCEQNTHTHTHRARERKCKRTQTENHIAPRTASFKHQESAYFCVAHTITRILGIVFAKAQNVGNHTHGT